MTDLISRLDNFVIALLDEAEVHCDKPAADVTNGTPTIMERVQVLKAAVGYLALRNRLTEDGGSEEPEAEEPDIVRFEQRIRQGRGRKTVR